MECGDLAPLSRAAIRLRSDNAELRRDKPGPPKKNGNAVENSGRNLNSDEHRKYRPVGRVVERRIGADRLLVPVSGLMAHRDRVFPVNETGQTIWAVLSTGRSLGDAADEVVRLFKVERDVALTDCAAFAEELEKGMLLEREETGPGKPGTAARRTGR